MEPNEEQDLQQQLALLKALADRPLTLPPIFVRITGSITGGLLLKQVLYWMGKTEDKQGWFYKRLPEFQEEMCMGEKEFRTARGVLEEKKFLLTERRGVPPVVWFRADLRAVVKAIQEWRKGGNDSAEESDSILPEGQNQLCLNDAPIAPKRHKPNSGERSKSYKEAETTRDYPETTGQAKTPLSPSVALIAKKKLLERIGTDWRSAEVRMQAENKRQALFHFVRMCGKNEGMEHWQTRHYLSDHPGWADWPDLIHLDSQQEILFPKPEHKSVESTGRKLFREYQEQLDRESQA